MTAEANRGRRSGVSCFSPQGWPYLLTPFIPLAVVLEVAHASAGLIFAVAALGIVPTAALMGLATEELAARSGPGHRRPAQRHLRQRAGADHRPVRAQRGPAGGRQGLDRRLDHRQRPARPRRLDAGRRPAHGRSRPSAPPRRSIQATMLFLAAAALVMPAIFELVEGQGLPSPDGGDRRLRLDGRGPLARGRGRPHRHLRRRALCSRCAPTRTSSTRPTPRRKRRASAGACAARWRCCSSPGSRSG